MVQQQQQNWWWSKPLQLLVLLAGVFFAGNTAVAQTNLVRNPHLDEMHQCIGCLGCYNLDVTHWYNYSQTSTSDYFNTCNNNTGGCGIPNNFGYQLPRSGEGYMHAQIVTRNNQNGFLFWFWDIGFEHSRENFFGEFTSPLQTGSYYVEIYTTLADLYERIIATNAFDMLLLEDTIYRPFTASPPHIDLQQVINLNPVEK